MIELRPYQVDAIERCRREVARGRRRVILVAATGSGKTVIASAIVAGAADKGKRALFLAHRRELVSQAARKLSDAGIDAGIVLPGFPTRPDEPAQVASVQSLSARAIRSSAMDMPPADLIVVDEAHHATAATYKAIIAAYPSAVILGLSATPARNDGRGLGNVFDCIVECPSVAELTRMGHLVPAKVFAPPDPDLEGIKVARGDYVEAQLAERMDKPTLVGDIVTHWLRHAERRRSVVFATSVAHSVHIRDEFNRAGVAAEHLDGSTPIDERDNILARLAAGAIDVVSNCAVLTEGWDSPSVACVVLARPTKSLGLYRQMAGRVLRPHPGKTDAIILDHSGATYLHGFVDDDIAWSLREDRRAENKAHAARGTYAAPKLVDCPECSAVRQQGKPCGACGWRPRRGAEAIEVLDGDLARVERSGIKGKVWTAAEKQSFQGQLAYIAAERGYSLNWVAHKFREKFKHWPASKFGAEAEAPTPETRSWVKSRQIAYAKAMQKAVAA